MKISVLNKSIGISIFLLLLSPSIFAQLAVIDSVSLDFQSNGFRISGFIFPAAGNEPLPTVILLHGYPGGEGDLFGLGRKMCENSINAYTFNYRGTWKSEGIYLPSTSLEDVEAAIQFLKLPDIASKFLIDTSNITLIGYSYGGGFALLGSLSDISVTKVVSIAGGDLSVVAKMIEGSNEFRKVHQAYLDRFMSDSTISRGYGGRASHEWLIKHKTEYSLLRYSKEIAQKSVFLIGGWQDKAIQLEEHILPLYRALQRNKASKLKIHVFDTDHSFKNVREQLGDLIISWIRSDINN
jgi:pimeloyl-ACP methyl ester carboxylesterase